MPAVNQSVNMVNLRIQITVSDRLPLLSLIVLSPKIEWMATIPRRTKTN